YQHVADVASNAAADVTDEVEQFLKDKGAGVGQAPFYASVGFEETHRPFESFDPVPPETVDVPPYLPDTDKVRGALAHFYASITEMDKAVGRIIRALDANGVAENTLVIYTTDHGIAFPRAKGTLFDAGLETALIMRLPEGMRNGGRIHDELLCNIDLMPTLLDLAGVDVPASIDGKSFLPLLKNESFAGRDSMFCEMTWHDRYQPMRGIRTTSYKYIRHFKDGPKVYLPLDIHLSPSGEEVRDEYYVPNSPEELY